MRVVVYQVICDTNAAGEAPLWCLNALYSLEMCVFIQISPNLLPEH